jgi:aromatic-L-amino-acid/L-tryptophan decarboxylase
MTARAGDRATDDAARTTGLASALAQIGPALDRALAAGGAAAAARSTWRARLDPALPDTGTPADQVLAELCEVVAGAPLPLGAPGACGWVATAPPVVPACAQLVAAVAAPQRWWVHPGNALEQIALGWIAELIGFGDAAGAFVSGGAIGNLVALAAARQRAGARRGVDVAADGVARLGAARLYAGDDVHPVVGRAAAVLGLGRAALVRVGGRRGLDPAALDRTIAADVAAGVVPVAIVATAGDASTGAIDPIGEVAEVARRHDTWLHVDGAYGAFGALDPRIRARLDLGVADSVAVDPHKWLGVPAGTGAVLVRDAAALEAALAIDAAAYLRPVRRTAEDPASPFDELGEGSAARSIEHSAPSRGVVVWAALRELGRAGLAARVARHLDCARLVADRVRATPGLELLAEPVLSIVCFRVRPPGEKRSGELDRVNETIARAVRARGAITLSTTRVGGKLALRPCFLGARTGLAEANLVVDEVQAVAAATAC